MTAEPAEIAGAGPDFPVEFAEPWHAGLTWEWDDMHMPFALAPLAGDYVRALGQGFNEWKTLWGDFPSRTYGAVFNGYAYFAFSQNSTDEERLANRERALQVWRERAEVTEAYWHDEVLPELQSIYASMRAVPVEAAAGPELAIAWEAAWEQAERAWRLHFNVILGPYQILEDLADLYESVTPGASPGEALQLIQGARHELFRMECGIEALTALADGAPDVAAALRAGTRSADELATIEGGRAFVDAFDAFLEEHGHMGQSADDLALA